MLTDEQKYSNRMRYFELLLKLNIDLTALTRYLDSPRVDFFEKPYNQYQDNAYAGSLCEYCLNLYDELRALCNLYCPGKYSDEDMIKVALLKDVYRAELYEMCSKNVRNQETNQWEVQTAYRTKEIRPIFGDINFSSYMIAKKFVDLSDELVETFCYAGTGGNIEIHNIRKSYKLVTLTTLAELAVMYLRKE